MAVATPQIDPRTGRPLNVAMPGTPMSPSQAGYTTPAPTTKPTQTVKGQIVPTPAPYTANGTNYTADGRPYGGNTPIPTGPVVTGHPTGEGTYGVNSATPGAAYGGTAAPYSILTANNHVPAPPQINGGGTGPQLGSGNGQSGQVTPTPMGQGNSGFSIDKNALQNEAAARIAKLRAGVEGAVTSGKASRKNLFDYNNTITQGNRAIQSFDNSQRGDQFGGSAREDQFRLQREQGINDTFTNNAYTNDINTLDNQLTSFDSLAPEQQQTLYNDLLRQEREYGLQEGALTGNFNGGQTLAAKTADQNYQLGLGGLTGSINGQDTLAKTNADRGYGLDLAGISGQLPNGGGQTLQAKQLDRNNFESDRSFELAKSTQDWNQTFQKEQYTDQKAQQLWENTFKTKDFQQSVKDAAASRGLQWASLNQRDKEFIADSAFREKSFQADQSQRGIDNAYRETQSKLSTGAQKEIDGLYTGLTTGQITPFAAIKELDQRVANGLETKDDAAKMKSFIQSYLEQGMTMPGQTGQKLQVSDNPNITSLSNSELRKLWKTDPTGEKAGRAQNDWGMWIKDPNGYAAGLSYELWHSEYGPTM